MTCDLKSWDLLTQTYIKISSIEPKKSRNFISFLQLHFSCTFNYMIGKVNFSCQSATLDLAHLSHVFSFLSKNFGTNRPTDGGILCFQPMGVPKGILTLSSIENDIVVTEAYNFLDIASIVMNLNLTQKGKSILVSCLQSYLSMYPVPFLSDEGLSSSHFAFSLYIILCF